ncbi:MULTISPECIES: hypothetical protein [unclassified Clostridium]|uniref:hypothetical protein n=1 Tax=unclassified Clostridium TaxID=2614128 RepID=UPI0002981370|nr:MULTISPECIES: hypothetical protein [unclassified Clostridium]EKQ52396.1 MAG: hypothetical protein A370_04229 [Clostridium sp. Maddingley MBC34-26]
MNKEAVKEILKEFGLSESRAEYYAEREIKDKFAWLSAFRFVRPLNNSLEFYNNEYADIIKKRIEKGLDNSEIETELLNNGATPELLGKFAYEIALTAFNEVLYRLSDPAGGDYDLENEGEGLPSWRLKERNLNNEVTKRTLAEMHNLIPFSNFE